MVNVSVILPVYNGDLYVEKCIQSVLDQTFSDFELVIVDDGSEDKTKDIISEYCLRDNRIKFVSNSHMGVVATRQMGIDLACGEYLTFIDSDDWWEYDFLEELYREISENDADIVATGCSIEKGDGVAIKLNGLNCGIYETAEELNLFFSNVLYKEGFYKFGLLPYLWNKIYRKEIFVKAHGMVDRNIYDGEDVVTLMAYYLMCRKVIVRNSIKYHYRIHSNQVTANKSDLFYENSSRLYLNILEVIKKSEYYPQLLVQLNQYMRYLVWLGKPEAFPQSERCIFPCHNLLSGKTVIIYGAGKMGRQLYNQIIVNKICTVKFFVDANYKNMNEFEYDIRPLDSLSMEVADYIIVSLANVTEANKVRTYLVEEFKIAKEKVVLLFENTLNEVR